MDAVQQKHNDGSFGQNYPSAQPTQQYPQQPQHPQYQEQGRVAASNWPQFLSVGANAFIIITGGMSVAWSLGFIGYTRKNFTPYMYVCWFAMVPVGAIFSACLTGFLKKKVLMFLSSILVMLGGILFLAFHENFGGIMAARHVNGFAVGWILVTTFVMAGEEAAKEVRGCLISSIEAVSFSFGILIQILYAVWDMSVNSDVESDLVHGTVVLAIGFIPLAIIFTLVIESPVYFLQKKQEELALESLLKLQRPSVDSAEKRAQLEHHKQYIAESVGNGSTVFSAVFQLGVLRGIIGLSFTSIVTIVLRYASYGAEFGSGFASLQDRLRVAIIPGIGYTWPFIVYGVCRFVGTIFGCLLQDRLGRKLTLAISMLICGGMAIGVGIIFNEVSNISSSSKMWTVLFLLLIYQFFTGICIPSSSSYMTEAFPVKAKPFCIAVVLTIEMSMFIICETTELEFMSLSRYFFALGGISLVYAVFTLLCLPETKKITLLEALRKSGSFINTKFH